MKICVKGDLRSQSVLKGRADDTFVYRLGLVEIIYKWLTEVFAPKTASGIQVPFCLYGTPDNPFQL